MRRLSLAAPLLLLPAALAAAQEGHQHAAPAGPPVPREAYALVGDVAVLRTAVRAAAARDGAPLVVAFQRAITTEVLRQNLVRLGADPAQLPDDVLDQGVAEARAALTARGLPEERLAGMDLRAELRVPVAFSRYVAGLVKDDELRAFFDAHKVEVAGEVRLRVLSLAIDPARGGNAGAVDRLMRLLPAPPATLDDAGFAKLAREHSDDPNAILTGGDFDWQSNDRPTIPLPLVRAGLSLGKPGLVPAPVIMARAVHLVWVTDVHLPETATFEALQPVMRARVLEKTASDLMAQWLKDTPVRIADDAPHYQPPR